MAEVQGIHTSITALIQSCRTLTHCLKDIKDAPKECDKLLRELQYLSIYLTTVETQTQLLTENDPWFATLQQLNYSFNETAELLSGMEKRLKATSPAWKMIVRNLPWTLSEEVAEDLRIIEQMKYLIMVAGEHNDSKLSCAIERTLRDDKAGKILGIDKQIQMDKKAAKVAAWLTSLNYNAVQREKLAQRFMNTGQWFLESSKFLCWADGSGKSRTLWCPGDPCAGKTIIASIVVEYLRTQVAEENSTILSVFCDYRNMGAQTLTNIIRALLKQLIQARGRLSSSIESLYKRDLKKQMYPSSGEFMELLSAQLTEFSCVYIVLDALDELSPDYEDWRQLIDALKSLGSNVRLLVTSTNLGVIRELFKEDVELCIRGEDDDIRKFIASKLEVEGQLSRHLEGYDDLRNKVLVGIVKNAHGLFPLAGIQLDLLARSRNRAGVVARLNELPQTMEIAYTYLLERIDHKAELEKNLAYRAFGWLAFSERPLTILELQHALAVESGTRELNPYNITGYGVIADSCAGLVVSDYRGYPRFVHKSAQEFIATHQDKLFPRVQEDIMRTCMTYLSFDVFHSPDVLRLSKPHKIYQNYPFFGYSLRNWVLHAKKCAPGSVEKEILNFLPTWGAIALSLEQSPDTELGTPARFTAYHGLLHAMKGLVDQGTNLENENVLCIAAYTGQVDMVKWLLSQENIDVNQADNIAFLIDYAKDHDSTVFTWMSRILLRGGKASHPTTPLVAAASNGHEEIVRMILESKNMRSLNTLPPSGPTALSAAVFGNHIGVVRLLLLEHDIDISIPFKGETPLMLAKRKRRDEIVKMLERKDGPKS
ncbi:uncharacterized protein EV420DRAFT_1648548 [Desarmillaria tabescens]|uniref:NACHT domain-containing protein n=1 Tax=Armillaria tabescens TaxID=1929756 RepID=A0AA39JMK2_ARMTA|nr:uncharacterized protein EV420DRAFT_1648548 [Desarmillaria tabescens]KAK0445032.1 hypothetical protein EV420DRAFT_1648548 [Desarmillaria tabescens]